MEPKKRVGIWVRVSTEFQVKDDSPEHHEQRARYYAEAKGWDVIEVYRLEAISGKTVMEVPETKRMLADIKSGRITALIFSKLARLARNTKELLEFSEMFRKENADLISLAENIDTSSPSGRLFFTIIAAMAEWERAEIADRVAASVPIRAKLGKPLGGAAPFGYRWIGKQLVVDQHEAPVRKLMYELFNKYQKKGVVAKKLTEMGHRTRNGSKFTPTTIGRLLHDTTAKGIRLANYTKSLGDGKNWVLKPESEWITTPCPPVVSEDVWEECNRILMQQEQKNKRAAKTTVNLFSGILYCSCGSKMYVLSEGSKYKCKTCYKTKIDTGDLEEIYYSNLKKYLLTDEHISKFLEKAKDTIAQKELHKQLLFDDKKKLAGEMDKTMRLYLDGQIAKDNFARFFDPLDIQYKQIEKNIPEIQAEIDFLKIEYLNGDAIMHEAKSLCDRWPQLPRENKRTIIEQITHRITVGGDTLKINFSYNPAFFQNTVNSERNLTDSCLR